MTNLDNASTHFINTKLIDDPLQTGAQLVVTVAGLLEDAQHCFNSRQQLFASCEVFKCQRGVRSCSESASDVHTETDFS